MASDLMEMVGHAVNNAMVAWAASKSALGVSRWDVPEDVIARAAIKAVAEWLDTQGYEQWFPGEKLREALEGSE